MLEPLEAGTGRKEAALEPPEDVGPCDTWVLDFWSPGLWRVSLCCWTTLLVVFVLVCVRGLPTVGALPPPTASTSPSSATLDPFPFCSPFSALGQNHPEHLGRSFWGQNLGLDFLPEDPGGTEVGTGQLVLIPWRAKRSPSAWTQRR